MPDALGLLVLGVAALIASTVGGVVGFGTGVIMVPVIAWTLGIKAAVPILGAYAVRLLVFRHHELISTQTVTIGVLRGAVMILGAFAGRQLLDRMSERAFVRLIETLLLVFGAQFLLVPGR